MQSNSHEPLILGPLIGGELLTDLDYKEIRSPYDDALFAHVHQADVAQMEKAIQLASESFEITKRMPAHERSSILLKIASLIERDREPLAQGITAESGKPISAARGEVDRAVFTFTVASEEARRIGGEILPLDWLPGNEKRQAEVLRVAKGPIAGITPFNFPINLVAHKVAPALAAGNPIIIRPASQTAVTAIRLGQLLVEAGWPKDAVAIVPCATSVAQPLIKDDRIKLLTFTGSPKVGWSLKGIAGQKPVTLELGGNAGNIICADSDLDHAAERITWGGFVNAGQACISVQRVYAEASVYEAFKEKLLEKVAALKFGDPALDETFVGPVIDKASADTIENSIKRAVDEGATLLLGGGRNGLVIEPTVIESDDESLEVSKTEVFGPVIVLSPFTDFNEAVQKVTTSDYGLQAGLFTRDMARIQHAIEHIEVGGLNVNDVSTFRIDHMPYGGVKGSGFGREGLKYAIEEMTEMKLVTYNHSIY